VATPARAVALAVLLDVEGRGPTLAARLARPDVARLPGRERRFVQELTHGVLRQRGRIDAALAPLVSRPLGELDGSLLAVLRLGAYQLLALRVPDRAAVSESVELARGAAPRATGLVNAVLRRLAREGEPESPDATRDPVGWLSGPGSLPGWLAARWLDRLGPARAVARARALLELPPCHLRVNPRLAPGEREALERRLRLEPLTVPGALRSGAPREAARLAERGLVFLQDQGSQLVARLAARDGWMLDACAAPGAKATLLADLARGGGVVALEPSPRRLGALVALARRWGSDLRAVRADARRPPLSRGFDAVLVDAPCSGIGTLGRHPDVRWRAAPGSLRRHAELQRALLAALAPLVAPGGRLVYSTCSTEPEENEDVVQAFLSHHAGFRPDAPAPDWAREYRSGDFYTTVPERDAGDAFFVAVLRRHRGSVLP
jgi:16S rRNA (cytosine967-C5)-methyltransferase